MSLSSPSKEETRWMDAVVQLGCIACRVMGVFGTPCEVHHILKNGKRIGHLHTIGLCPSHHRSELNTWHIVSRHPWRKQFERAYGKENDLLELTRRLVKESL